MPIIGITRWSLPVLIIIKSMTVVLDLAIRYGFPVSDWAHILTSTSAYINEKLFVYWVEKILVPGVEARRRAWGLSDEMWYLLILDGCLAHNEVYL